jgi:hypothetical protein
MSIITAANNNNRNRRLAVVVCVVCVSLVPKGTKKTKNKQQATSNFERQQQQWRTMVHNKVQSYCTLCHGHPHPRHSSSSSSVLDATERLPSPTTL